MERNEIHSPSYNTQTVTSQNKENMKSTNLSKSPMESMSQNDPKDLTNPVSACAEKYKNEVTKTSKDKVEEPRTVLSRVESIKKRRREELLARKKYAEEERDRIVNEAIERKAAEREEIIKQAKRLILYRKPLCRPLNQALLLSECLRELEDQVKLQETIKNMDKQAEMNYVDSLRADVAKYQEEEKQKDKERLEKNLKYADDLKKQIEENENDTKTKQKEKFETEKEDSIQISKYLQDLKEYEANELLKKQQTLKQMFENTIQDKKQLELKLKREEMFEDRAMEIYQKSKDRIKKLHKTTALKQKQEKERKVQIAAEIYEKFKSHPEEAEEKIFKKALEEKKAIQHEKDRLQKEHRNKMRKERQEFQIETMAAKSKQLQENRSWKDWEMIQRFKKAEYNEKLDLEERIQERNKRMEYAKTLKKYINEKEAERKKEEKMHEQEDISTKQLIERENQKVLNYAEEILNESKDVRPIYPIQKAIRACKKEMGLLPLKKDEAEQEVNTEPKRKRIIPRVCTTFVPEDQICYL